MGAFPQLRVIIGDLQSAYSRLRYDDVRNRVFWCNHLALVSMLGVVVKENYDEEHARRQIN